jgi:hypothetical protein
MAALVDIARALVDVGTRAAVPAAASSVSKRKATAKAKAKAKTGAKPKSKPKAAAAAVAAVQAARAAPVDYTAANLAALDRLARKQATATAAPTQDGTRPQTRRRPSKKALFGALPASA